jgi:hypothetical protein
MPDRDLRHLRVKELLAQDPEINDTQLKEFRMQLDQLLESYEQKSKRTRRRILIALAVYLAGMVICWSFVVFWHDAAPSLVAGLVRGLIYWPFLIAALAAALTGIWLVALYVFKYAPQVSRARFDVQTSMMLELQQQMKQLHENIERPDK